MDFEVQRCTRRCAVTEREFKPGETFYSAILPDGGGVKRVDYAVDGWQGPPENAIGHWRSQMPDLNTQKVHWAPSDVILHYFCQLDDEPENADTRFVLALLMIRRRILRLEENQTDDDGQEAMVLFCTKNDQEYRVKITDPSPDKVIAIQDELAELLFSGRTNAESGERTFAFC